MAQHTFSDQGFLAEGLREIVDHSLNWLRPACNHMLDATRKVGQEDGGTASPESASLNPASLMAAIQRKTLDYLTGQNAAVRLALIDQNDYDILVEELAAYRDEMDQQDTALGFIEKHLGRLLNRRIVRDSNPYSLRNLAHFTLEALGDQGVGHGIRRALLRDFLDYAVSEMQTGLWDLANDLEPLAKKISEHPAAETYPTLTPPSRHPIAGEQAPQPYASFGLPDLQTQAVRQTDAKTAEANQFERLLNALDSFERYKSGSGRHASRQVSPAMLAQWASQSAADATVMKGVIASGMLAGVAGVGSEANMPLDGMTAVLMEQVARNNEALVQNPDHPVRQLLNRLFATFASSPAPDELSKLKEWVESAGRVLLHKPQEASLLLGELERLGASSLLRRRDRLLERQLELESWHRMLRAKQRSKETLDKSLAGHNLHRKAAAFAQQYWSHVLTMIALRHNPGTHVWNEAQEAATVLGQNPLSHQQLEKLDAVARRELGTFFNPEEARQALEGWLSQLEEETPSAGNTQMWKGLTGVEEMPAVPASDMPKPLLGSWVRFADKPWPYPLQLIWSSLPFGYLGFTDTAAEQSFRIDAGEWEKHLSAGRVEDYGVTSFEEMPPLLDRNLESWSYENQLLSTLRDGGTGLLNRRGLVQALAGNDMDDRPSWQLLVMEIPGLAERYLQEGQQAGDKLLTRLVGLFRSQDYGGLMLARLSESRFAAAAPRADTTLAELFKPLLEEECRTAQAGWYFHLGFCPEAPPDEALLKAAEEAVEEAGQAGQNTLQVKALEDSQLESWMRATTRIIREGRLELHAQPMQALKDGLHSHAEILLRLKSEDDTYHLPGLFLREAERQKLMPQVDLWVLRNLGEWLQGRVELPLGLSGLAVNLSGQTLSDPVNQETISEWIRQSGVNPAMLIFEITETSAVANLDQVGRFLRDLRELGCRTALDDFGSGYANYAYLRELPFDYLKIDGSFVRNLAENETDRALVASMVDVAKRFGLKCIAEFVHDVSMVPILQDLGVDYGQGYALGKPVPLAQLGADPSLLANSLILD